jgi:hypothetical protein
VNVPSILLFVNRQTRADEIPVFVEGSESVFLLQADTQGRLRSF